MRRRRRGIPSPAVQALHAAGHTVTGLAAALGVSVQAISQQLTGERPISLPLRRHLRNNGLDSVIRAAWTERSSP